MFDEMSDMAFDQPSIQMSSYGYGCVIFENLL